ncbi:MAG TPA: chromosome segregation protein SMC [Candidatus Binatia bacterium]
MRLKSIEMVGFKSFVDKTTIELNPGITAIVGPNGCGKSNIVDAIRWAMGEQSARYLRGHQMEDVVFNGSESLSATGMAEVSLIFENEDGRAPIEYSSFSEIMVTRRLFRSGESEYAINKTTCRLKDVIEFFLGTGVGSKAYSIVEQGKVDELVNSKPEDRRSLIEEAAGTSKYKSRKLVAERKLERTQQNLLRVSDIVREIERQIHTMELQAKKAERYRALKAQLKEKDLLYAAIQQSVLNQEISAYEFQLNDAEGRFTQYVTALRSREAESETVRLSLMDTEQEIAVQQEVAYQTKIQIQAEEQRIDFYNKDLARLAQAEADTRAALCQLEEKINTLGREIDDLEKARESFTQLSLFEESFLQEREAELATIQLEVKSLQGDLDREKEALIETANQITYLRNDSLAKSARCEEIGKELARNREEHAAVAISLSLCEQKLTDSKKAEEICLAQANERKVETAEVNALIQSLVEAKKEQEKRAESLKERIHENRSRLLSLEELQRNYEGYQEGVRAIMLKRQRETQPNGIYGLVAEVIEAPEPYEKALTAVLGDRLQYVIVKGQEEGVEAIEYLKREASGRGSFIPLQLSRRQHRPLPLGEAEVISPLLEVISVKEGYGEVAEYLLSDVVLVRDLRAGLSLWNRNGFYSTLVTPDGEVIDPMGTVTGGSDNALEGNFITQRRHIRELKALLAEFDRELQLEDRQVEKLKEDLQRAETKQASLAEELHRLEIDRVRLEHEHSAADRDVERLSQTARALVQEQGDLATALEQVTRELDQCRAAIEMHIRDKTEKENLLSQKQAALLELQQSVKTVEAAVTQSRIRKAALGEKRENAHHNLDNRFTLRQETLEQIGVRQQQIADIDGRRSQIELSLAESARALESGNGNLQELEARLQGHRHSHKEISRNLLEIEESIKELRPLGEACQEERNRLQVVLAEKKLRREHIAANVRERYDADLENLCLERSESMTATEDLLAEIDDLRGRLERMGEVNLAAIGEYEELSTRFQFMNQQKEDLEKSIADLQRTIIKLNRICRLRFKESFEEINEKFQSIFPRLFRGGKARLVLTDENDYLETGVDIVVQPPGKKLQFITLLSGGEKALTAVSLLFAIFLTKPSPFCFLDEVDAPLDDANIDRFNDIIKEMSQVSQFVLVTHNKKTMQVAEVLYGITMAEPGVSKVVSVRMS